MYIIFLIQAIYSLSAENFLCGLRLFYEEQTFFLIDQQNDNTMPYILTSSSPHFALDIQQSYKSSQSLNNNPYFLVGFSDSYIFVGNASEIQWLLIQEFKVKKNITKASVHMYNGYNGYFVDKGEDGGHLLISKENLVREFSFGKTDAVDKFQKMGFIYIVLSKIYNQIIVQMQILCQLILYKIVRKLQNQTYRLYQSFQKI